MHDLAGYVALEGRAFSLFAPPIGTAFETHRHRIDRFDAIIVRMLSERAKIALELARVKSRLQLPVLAPEREAAVLDHVQRLNSEPISPDAIARIYSVIIREMRDLAASVAPGKEAAHETEQPVETI
jgi:chorismate mutase